MWILRHAPFDKLRASKLVARMQSAVTNTVAGQVTRFYRDADGNLVKKSDAASTMMVVNAIFEHITTTNQSTSYYMFGGQRVAMRTGGTVYWLHGDHLGSASLTTNASGQKVAELRYLPFGETRWMSGTTPTDRRYTGQRELAGVGLYDYNARMYWPAACPERSRRAGRFVSADTIVPDSTTPQSFNRYAYVLNNPLRYGDPTGHCPAPPPEFGPAICFALFIKPSEIAAGPVIVHGDGRDFSKDSNPAESRAWVWISTVEKDKVILGMNPTGYVFGDHIAWVSPAADNKLEAKRSDTGAIEVSYDLVLSGFLQDIAPHINGSIIFAPDEKAGGYVAYGERDGFPWAEAYYHDGRGRVQTIFQKPALRGNPHDLNAIETYDFSKKPLHEIQRRLFDRIHGLPREDTLCVTGRPC